MGQGWMIDGGSCFPRTHFPASEGDDLFDSQMHEETAPLNEWVQDWLANIQIGEAEKASKHGS